MPDPGEGDKIRERRGCGFYLRQPHRLIRRHAETLAVNADHTASWRLKIDFELPTDPDAYWGGENGEHLFLFPLVYLRKSAARIGFEVRDEEGTELVLPIRGECDRISTAAAAQAIGALTPAGWDPLPVGKVEDTLREIPAGNPLESSMALVQLRRSVGLDDDHGKPVKSELGTVWAQAGLDEVLRMLVEHSMIWVPLRGRPGERRSITVAKQISLERKAFLRWIFGSVKGPRCPHLQRFKAKRARRLATADPGEERESLLMVGRKKRYFRRGRRISFSALGERIGQPLAWMPFEFEFPTIYTKRCDSYHLEVICPSGRSPRDLRPSIGTPLAEPPDHEKREKPPEGRTSLGSRIAHHYLPGSDFSGDIWFRVTIGVGNGAFPGLWFMAAAITAILLWIFAGSSPPTDESPKEIAAGILLVVPALIAALAIGANEVPITQLMSGARVLLMVTGLSAVVATSVLAGAKPFHMDPSWTWTACAIVATAAAVPLGASWLLSSPLVWGWMKKLNSADLQKDALRIGAAMALLVLPALVLLRKVDVDALRGATAVYLIVLAIVMSVVANNRAPIAIGQSRRYVTVSFLGAAMACLALACIELATVVDAGAEVMLEHGKEHKAGGTRLGTSVWVLIGFVVVMFRSPWIGERLHSVTKLLSPKEDEIHVSPQVGRALIAEETVRELTILREREDEMAAKEAVAEAAAGDVPGEDIPGSSHSERVR